MKKSILIGFIAGVSVSLIIFFLRRQKKYNIEFDGNAKIADSIYGEAFKELPDKY